MQPQTTKPTHFKFCFNENDESMFEQHGQSNQTEEEQQDKD